jgi:hypothetical protein
MERTLSPYLKTIVGVKSMSTDKDAGGGLGADWAPTLKIDMICYGLFVIEWLLARIRFARKY